MATQIYYFSGTGNSLQIARELQNRLPDTTLVPIVRALKSGAIQSSAESVGIVFPIFAFSLPPIVIDFLKHLNLDSATYLFAVTSRHCRPKVFRKLSRLTQKNGKALDAHFSIQMPENYVSFFDSPTSEEIRNGDEELQEKLAQMQAVFAEKKAYEEVLPMPLPARILIAILFPVMTKIHHVTRFMHLEKKLYADSQCTGCGICEKICLSGKIQIKDGRPVWNPDVPCHFCLACIHFCPAKAIQIRGSKTPVRGRYTNASVTANDIAAQK